MSAEMIPSEVVAIAREALAAEFECSVKAFPASPARARRGEMDHTYELKAIVRAILTDRSTRPAEPAAPTVDTIAAFLHNEIEWPEDNYPAYAWPEVDGDTGQRDGGYVKIVPKYVVEEFRGIARRLLIAFRQEGVVPAEPAAPVAEAGDGDVALKSLLAAIQLGHAAYDADESSSDLSAFREAYGAHNAIEQLLANLRSTLEAERARADAAEQRAADALARAEKTEGAGADDRRRLNWLEANTSAVISHEGFEDDVWQIHTVSGNRSDLEWTKRAEADTVREAIDAAIRAIPPRASREAQPATDGGDNG